MSVGQKEQTMSMGQMLAAELRQEIQSTRKMLERLPADKFGWKPHEKSMTLERLAGHVVEMISWTKETLTQPELDFSKFDYKPREYKDAAEMVADLDENSNAALEILNGTSNETMAENWSMRNGEQIYFTMPKAVVMRTFVMNHVIHHRGQLSVYMRLLDIPVPSIYGPSADEAVM
ncbi:MAG TPA: DinB family protein [Pyrinomonadaceae bacterium]|nr:DinB family protein [Pyrinomonadaceae bacterium]